MLRRIFSAMAESAPKRLKSGPTIGTHNGHFHADEALAVHMLRMLPEYRHSPLVRTRDPKVLETCHTVVDVGSEYDPERHRYDHHQRGFTTTFPGRPTKLSSAGLVYMHFGRAIIAQTLGNGTKPEDTQVGIIHDKLYESFVEALDAHDNGISKYDTTLLRAAGVEKRFKDGGFGLGAMVSRLNRNWNDPQPEDPVAAQDAEDSNFEQASQRIGEEFERDLQYFSRSWLPAREIVEKAFERRMEFDPQGRILVFEGQSLPWKEHLYRIEGGSASVLYVLYAESSAPGAKWRIQCVPESEDSFVSRKPLPEAWRGFRDEELDTISGVKGCVFVHAAGFIGGNKTFEGVKEMAAKALL